MVYGTAFPMDFESNLLAKKQVAQQQLAQGANLDLGTVGRLVGIQQNWGWIPPSAQLALAQSGYHANSPETAQVAQLSAAQQLRQNRIADEISKVKTASDVVRLSSPAKKEFLSQYTPQEQHQIITQGEKGILASVAPGGGLLGTIESKAGQVVSGALHGDIGEILTGKQSGTPSEQGSILAPPATGGIDIQGGIKAATREAGAVAAYPLEAGQGIIRNTANAIANRDFSPGSGFTAPGQIGSIAEQTQLGQQLKPGASANDLGGGYLPDPNSPVAKAAQQAQRNAAPTIGGHAFSVGRQVASEVFEPNTTPYNIVSGAIDGTIAFRGDPAAGLLAAGAEERAGAKLFTPEASLETKVAQAGGTAAEQASARVADAAWQASRDPKLVKQFAGAGISDTLDRDARALANALPFSTQQQLANASTPEQVVQALRDPVLSQNGVYSAPRTWLATKGSTASQFWDSITGKQVINKIAETSSPSQIIRDYHIPAVTVEGMPVARMLANENDPEKVAELVKQFSRPDVFAGPTQVPGGLSYAFKNTIGDSRLFGMVPDRLINPQDKSATWNSIDGFLRSAKVPIATRDRLLDSYLSADPGDPTYKALVAASDTVRKAVEAHGITDPEILDRVSNFALDTADSVRHYDYDQATHAERVRAGVAIDGAGNGLPASQLSTEGLNRGFQLPDMRDLRRATSAAAPIVNSTPWLAGSSVLDSFMSMWKDLHLLRPGLGVRVTGDSQLSLAANGYDSLWNHPLNLISAMIGGNLDKHWAQAMDEKLGAVSDALGHVPFIGERLSAAVPQASMAFDSLGQPMVSGWDDVQRELYGAWSAIDDPSKVAIHDFAMVPRSDKKYAQGLAEELNRLRGDPRVRGIVNQESPEAARDWLWNSEEGTALREKFQPLADQMNEANRGKVALGLAPGGYKPLDFTTREGSDEFVNNILDRVNDTTGGNEALLDAIRTGKINGTSLTGRITAGYGSNMNADALDQITAMAAEGAGPDMVKARRTMTLTRSAASRELAQKNQVVQWMFDHMLTLPDAVFDRNPAYLQSYWGSTNRAGEVEKLLPYATPEAYDKIMSNAEAQNLPDEVMARLRGVSLDGGEARRLNADQFHQLAKGNALSQIPKVVHDLSSRSNFFDAARYLFPFGDAFRRIATRWATTAWEHPNVLRRAQQGITTARESGFFHTDPVTRAEVFTYPGSSFLTDKLIGVPVPLTGQVGGLSLVGEGLPGVGPAVTVPAQYMIQDVPYGDKVANVIWPQGQPQRSPGGIAGEIAQSAMPAWLDKVTQPVTGYHDQRAYNDTVGSMMRYLASTGDYKLGGPNAPAEMDRLMSDAKDKAKWFYVVRGFAQSSMPSAPAPDWQIKDPNGHLATASVVVDDYHKEEAKVGPDGAFKWLLDHYGPNNIFVAQPFSQAQTYGIPITKPAQDWANANSGVRDKYPNTYGLFAPQGGKFDITAYAQQFVRGERVSLTPKQQMDQANNRVGMYLYHQTKDKMLQSNGGDPLDGEQNAWLKKFQGVLQQRYPGFNLVPFDDKKLPRAVNELIAASHDPNVNSTDAGQGLRDYLQFRDEATKVAQSDSYGLKSPFKAKAARPLRDWLRQAAAAIIKKHPDFGPMYEQVLSHEMTQDGPQGATG